MRGLGVLPALCAYFHHPKYQMHTDTEDWKALAEQVAVVTTGRQRS